MKVRKLWLLAAFALSSLAGYTGSPKADKIINAKPFTVPEVKEWRGGEGTTRFSFRIVYKRAEEREVAQLLAADYERMFGKRVAVVNDKVQDGDIVLNIKRADKLGEEGYLLDIGTDIRCAAATRKGLYWSTRTLLQIFEQSKEHQNLPQGRVTDRPDYPFRGFMLDCGRKFFPMTMLRDYVRIMAYYKMNVFHIHLNDNAFQWFYNNDWSRTPAAFRLESDRFPGLTARDGHYTKREFIGLQRLADSLGVEIIPEIDVPAHSLALTRYRPDLISKDYPPDHLDLMNPKTWDFCDSLFTEYLEGPDPVFRGRYVHVGTDEYSNKDQQVVEKFRAFTDHYIRLVERYGRRAAIWGQQTHAKGTTPIKVRDVLMYAWSNDYSKPDEMMKLGYHLVSIPDRNVYIVPKAGYYYDYLNTKWLYNNWTPANINGMQFPERSPLIEGGCFALWNDIAGNGISDKDVHYRVVPAMKTLATKMWTGAHPSINYASFAEKATQLSEAPGLNYAGRYPKGIVLTAEKVEKNTTIESIVSKKAVAGDQSVKQIGWKYNVSFDIDAHLEKLGTVLFACVDTKFYLSDPISGKIGFSRDGYLDTFDYQFFPGEKVHVEIDGDQEQTSLWVNGKCVSSLPVKKINLGKRGDMYYISTLVFPLEHTGDFESIVSNLRVESKVPEGESEES